MLTPQEVTGFKLEKAVFGGYDIPSTDKFLDQLSQDYTALYRENGILKTKMKVLVDKVEEYRSTEDAMRMALLQAEKTAKEITTAAEARRDSVEEEVEKRRAELLSSTEEEAEKRRAELRDALASEEAALANAKRATAEYLERLRSSMAAYAENLAHIYDYVEPLPPVPEAAPAQTEQAGESPDEGDTKEIPVKEPVSQDTVENIAEIINRAFSSVEQAEKAPEEDPNPESTISKLPRIDYDNLQFGDNYSPTKK